MRRFVVVTLGFAGLAGCAVQSAPPTSSAFSPDVPVIRGGSDVAVAMPQPTPPPPPPPDPFAGLPSNVVEAAGRLTNVGVTDHTAWERLAYMVDAFGHRLSGSDGLEQAIDWAVTTMAADGLANARREPVMVKRWERGEESATVIAPREKSLYMLGLGNSVGTGRRGVRAEVVLVPNLEAIDGLGDAARGKIVAVTQAMPEYDVGADTSHYGEAVQPRLHAASRAAKLGAKAVLIRSVTATNYRLPHTGTLVYAEDAPKIPAAALSPEDMMYLERVHARGETIKIELKMGARMRPDRESANAVAELVGRERPDEVVVIGCHLDAWDVGDGAHDDGAGCLMAMEAGRVLQAMNLQPRRTIRVVLFTNEENGGAGGRAYFEAHKNEAHVAAIEADSGSFAPRGFGIGAVDADVAALQPYAMLFSELGADTFTRGGGGADIAPLVRAGVLGIAVRPEGNEYFDLHHSPADTVDKVDPGHLQRNAMAMALMAFILAERDLPEGTAPVVPAADRPPPAIDPTTTPPASAPTPAPTPAPKKR